MSIASEIQRLQTAKADIKAALEGKGIPVSSKLKIDGYAELIESIVPDIRVVAKFNVTDTSNPTQLCLSNRVDKFSALEIDGVAQPSVVSSYTFSTLGEHTVKYTLTDPITIAEGAFYGCSGLTSVTIPNAVTSIDNSAFRDCSGLTSVTILNSVTSIGDYAFSGTAWYNNQPDGVVYIGKVLYNYKGTMPEDTSINIEEGTVSISSGAFRDCSGLTSVTIPNSVTKIGDSAFSGCSGLTSVTIPNSVTKIGDSAFSGCSGLTSVTIPNSVTSIGWYAFSGCSGLTSVTIGNSVTDISGNAFQECSGLTSVHITDIAVWCNIYFYNTASNPLGFAHHLYMNGSEITDLVIPNSVTKIGDGAFRGCSGLTSVTIPNSVTKIGDSAFRGCSGLTSVTIPNSVTSIGNSAFRKCVELNSIISNATTAPTITSGTFRDVKTGGILTVPSGSTGYDTWMGTGNYYLGKYGWTKVEQ